MKVIKATEKHSKLIILNTLAKLKCNKILIITIKTQENTNNNIILNDNLNKQIKYIKKSISLIWLYIKNTTDIILFKKIRQLSSPT